MLWGKQRKPQKKLLILFGGTGKETTDTHQVEENHVYFFFITSIVPQPQGNSACIAVAVAVACIVKLQKPKH